MNTENERMHVTENILLNYILNEQKPSKYYHTILMKMLAYVGKKSYSFMQFLNDEIDQTTHTKD